MRASSAANSLISMPRTFFWANAEHERARQAERRTSILTRCSQILEREQGEIKKIAEPQAGIEHAERFQPVEKRALYRRCVVKRQCVRRVRSPRSSLSWSEPSSMRGRYLRFCFIPFFRQGTDDHRIDDQHDLLAIRIMRAQLAAL